MILKKVGILGLILMLLHWMALRVLAARHGMDVGSIVELKLDERTVEQMCRDCGLDLVAIKEEVRKDTVLDSTKINTRAELLTKGTVQGALNVLSLKANRSFLDCLMRQNFRLDSSQEENLRIWLADYLDSLLHRRRRLLVAQDYKGMPPSLAPALPPGIDSTLPNERTSEPASAKKPTQSKSHDLPPPNNVVKVKDAIFMAVIMTAVLTATLVALLLSCYFVCKEKSRCSGYRKDDKPLLGLNLSDFSGSSQKSFGNENGLLAPPKPLKTDPTSQNIQVSSTDSSVETQASEILQWCPNSSDGQSNINTDETSLSKSPPPPSPKVPTSVDKPSPPPPPPPSLKAGHGPPPPPKCSAPPRPPHAKVNILRPHKPPPNAPKQPGEDFGVEDDSDAPKTKLKPFFWDKVQANPSRSMVWDRLKAGSFQFNEEMIENLFGYNDQNKEGKKVLSGKDAGPQYVRILDPKKSQNLAISLKALNVKADEVREALMEGSELPPELLHTLLKMAPTTDEELKIRLHADPTELGPAEQFIRTIVEVPFAFLRLEALLFMMSFQEEFSSISEAFSIIDVACKELRSSRLFLKLLEAILKTGNRMNDGTYRGQAQAFKLDTLLKLSDVKGTDGKTTLLHFVVLEIIRTEGIRASRTIGESRSSISSLNCEDLFDDPSVESGDYYHNLGFKVVSGLSDELQHVRKAAGLDADILASNVESLSERLAKTKGFLRTKMEGIDEESEFLRSMRGFVEHAEAEINGLLEEEKKIRSLVKNTTNYFHGNSAKDEGLRMFVIVRDFLGMIDKVCKEVKVLPKAKIKTQRSREVTPAMSPVHDPRQLLFPAIKDRRMDFSDSSDDDD